MALGSLDSMAASDGSRQTLGFAEADSFLDQPAATGRPLTSRPAFAALGMLAVWQTQAQLARLGQSFRSPRRQWIALLAVVLAIVWLGQAIISMLFRQAADPALLAIWVPFSLTAYTAWHFIKSISTTPTEPFDWSPAEVEILCGAPFSRSQLILYRLQTTVISALAKSSCFTLVMIPDLKFPLAGLVGMFAGLVLVDLLRMLIQIGCFGISKQLLGLTRLVSFTALVTWVGYVFVGCLGAANAAEQLASPGAFRFAQQFGETLFAHVTIQGSWLLFTFEPAANVILTNSLDADWIGQLLVSLLLGTVGLMGVIGADRWALRITQQREQTNYQRVQQQPVPRIVAAVISKRVRNQRRIFVPLRMMGAGSIAWRQLLGAWHFRGTLAISLGVPICLCCLPLFAKHEQFPMLMHIVGGLVFYSFLLLPPALMLDFRRDAKRLGVLKQLPITPLAVTIGELAAPVLICIGFQSVVLAISTINGALSLPQAMLASLLLWPVCCLIFATENLVFMLAPHRQNQEGLEVFVRTLLVFTAKGIFLALALAGMLAWAFASRSLSGRFVDPVQANRIIFGAGVWLVTSGLAAGAIGWLAKLYDQFDPSSDAAHL